MQNLVIRRSCVDCIFNQQLSRNNTDHVSSAIVQIWHKTQGCTRPLTGCHCISVATSLQFIKIRMLLIMLHCNSSIYFGNCKLRKESCDCFFLGKCIKTKVNKSSLGWDPANGIDMTTASESAGRQIQNNRNPIIKIPQTYKFFTPF